jgi:hypothetical protein
MPNGEPFLCYVGRIRLFIICITVNDGSMIIGKFTQWLVEKFLFFTYVHKFMYILLCYISTMRSGNNERIQLWRIRVCLVWRKWDGTVPSQFLWMR